MTDAFGGMGTLEIDWAIKEYREKSRASDKRKERREQGAEKKWELLVSSAPHDFTAHSCVRLPLEMERLLPVHNISW